MKFICQKDILLNAVQTTAKAAAGKSSIPALEGILLELEGNNLTVTGYNLDIGIKTEIQVNGIESGNIVINARMAGDIIRKMPSDEITFSCDSNNMAVIVSRDTEFSVMCMSADDYPVVPQVNPETSFSVPQKIIKSMINQTKFAVAVTDTKPALMGCKFEITDNILSVVAVDGVRIALRQEPVVYDNIEFIVPAKTLDELVHILEDDNDKNITFCIDKNQISFSTGNYIMISRLIDGEFIQYRNHLSCNDEVFAEVNCREMINMLERSMLIINEKNKNPIRCELNGDTLSMSCTTGLGKINDKIAVKYSGQPIIIGFNAKYMLDAFKACDSDSVKLIMSSSVAPIIIKPLSGSEFTFLVLPMRLK
ncbi:MAG: DNA polymerase III subunit beta [Oscillospiraceae bacterium]